MKRYLAALAISSLTSLPALAGEFLWGLDNTSTASLKKVDLQTGVVVASIGTTTLPSGLSLQNASGVGLCVINGRNVVLVSNPVDRKVLALDRVTGAYVGGYSTANLGGAYASGIGWNGGSKSLLVDATNDQMVVVDSEASITNGGAVTVSNVLKVGQGFAAFDVRGGATGLGAGHRFFVTGAASPSTFGAPSGAAPLLGMCEVELKGQTLSLVRLIQRVPAVNSGGTLFGTGSDQITAQPGVGALRGRLLVDDVADDRKLTMFNLNGEAVGTIFSPAGPFAEVSEVFLDGFDAAYRYMIPSAAKAPSAGGSFYVSDLTISNLSAGPATVTVEFLVHDGSSSTLPSATLSLGAGEGKVLTDVLGNTFGQTSNYGALRITSNVPLNAACNTYLSGNPAGQFGQSLPATDLLAAPAGSTFELVQLDQNTTKRSNVVLANPGATALPVRIDFLDSAGSVLGSKSQDVPPESMVQLNEVFTSIGLDNVTNGRIQVTAQKNGVFAAAAYVIDRGTNDPFAVAAHVVSP